MDWYGAARALMAAYEAEIAARVALMASGGCSTMDEYREGVGYVRGLRHAIAAIHARLTDDEKRALGVPTGGASSPKRKG